MSNTNRSGLIRRCCAATAAVVLLLALVLVVVYFTMLKPKPPKVADASVTVRNVDLRLLPRVAINVTLDVEVLVENPNYASFEYDDATTLVFYRGAPIGEGLMPGGEIGARSSENVSASVDVEAAKVASDPFFLLDVVAGSFNVTSTLGLRGRVVFLFKLFRLHASASVSCDITVHVRDKKTTSSCKSNYKVHA